MRRPTRTLLISAAALTMMSLAGCGAKEPTAPPALSPAQTTTEYRAEAATLQLAPGWSWPASPIPATAPDGSGNVYEPGYGKQAADHYWFCSWSDRTLDGSLPAAARQTALADVLDIRNTYYYLTALAQDSKPYLDHELQSAQLGDYSLLKNDYLLNCPTAQDG